MAQGSGKTDDTPQIQPSTLSFTTLAAPQSQGVSGHVFSYTDPSTGGQVAPQPAVPQNAGDAAAVPPQQPTQLQAQEIRGDGTTPALAPGQGAVMASPQPGGQPEGVSVAATPMASQPIHPLPIEDGADHRAEPVLAVPGPAEATSQASPLPAPVPDGDSLADAAPGSASLAPEPPEDAVHETGAAAHETEAAAPHLAATETEAGGAEEATDRESSASLSLDKGLETAAENAATAESAADSSVATADQPAAAPASPITPVGEAAPVAAESARLDVVHMDSSTEQMAARTLDLSDLGEMNSYVLERYADVARGVQIDALLPGIGVRPNAYFHDYQDYIEASQRWAPLLPFSQVSFMDTAGPAGMTQPLAGAILDRKTVDQQLREKTLERLSALEPAKKKKDPTL